MAEPDRSPDRPGAQRSVVFPSPVVDAQHRRGGDGRDRLRRHPRRRPGEREVATPVRQEQTTAPAGDPTTKAPKPKPKPKPVQRAQVYVEVYNNSGITGLAGTVGQEATAAGWKVVGTDNWYGTIPTNTVYYPPSWLEPPSSSPSTSGIDRTAVADGAMKLDRLTVILTGSL